jgi:hypothetical protein
MEPPDTTHAVLLGEAVIDCIKANLLDEAEIRLQELYDACPAARSLLVFPIMIALQRGRAEEAWQLVNGTADNEYPDLKALCLRVLNDPLWHSYAVAHEDHPDPYIRKAMRELLGRPVETDADESIS